ncbi:MAG: hypothetical protein WAK34_15910, partial [Rhodoplanes sp.]
VDALTAAALIAPAPDNLLEAYEVSLAVNRAANDSPALIEPLAAGQGSAPGQGAGSTGQGGAAGQGVAGQEGAGVAAPETSPPARKRKARNDDGQAELF